MNALEALMWRAEADPTLRSHVVVVEILDRVPDWQRLVAAHDWGTRMVPRLRERVVEPPLGLGVPVWSVDDRFDLAYHLRRAVLPAPGRFDELLELAQSWAMAPLDRVRAQWEALLVEGLDGDRSAYMLKLHHSLSDGLGFIQLLSMLHSPRREPDPDKPQPPPPPPEALTPSPAAANQLAGRLAAAPRGALRAAAGGLSLAGRCMSRPDRELGEAVHFARSARRVLAGPPTAGSPLLRGRSLSWRFAAHAVPLDDLRAAAKSGGGSLNDAFLAALLGAFRRYHEHFDAAIDTMPVAIPISLRTGDDPMGGNRIAGARFAAPVGERDPRERIRVIREFVVTARAEPAIDAMGLVAPALSRLPAALLTRLTSGFTHANDLQASNVPGIPRAAYLAGARITHMYPFGPLPGCAAMIALVSHDGTCCIGANVDPAAVTDPEVFGACLRAGFDEVLGLHTPERRPTRKATT